MLIKKTVCDRCGATIDDAHAPRLVKQVFQKSDKATSPSHYVNTEMIHLCDVCAKYFEDFLKDSSNVGV